MHQFMSLHQCCLPAKVDIMVTDLNRCESYKENKTFIDI